MTDKPHFLFLFSDTGGGHRSAAAAIIEAMQHEYRGQTTIEMVDIFKQYAPIPLNRMPDLYPRMVRIPQAWELGYRLSDGKRRARLFIASLWPYVRRAVGSLVAHHPSDLIISVHPLANASLLRALGERRPPFVTVVTDLVTTHSLWYDRRADLCLVPTQQAYERALEHGLDPMRVKVVGLPVAAPFWNPPADRERLRARLNWPDELPLILLVGGGDGMGPLESIARTIALSGLKAGLAVVCGRNQNLRTRLEERAWPRPTFIYGFVENMPELMWAADVLVTKAGSVTISEAFNAGLPLVIFGRLPGQEDGNVAYVVSEGAGVWAPDPNQVVAALRSWFQDPHQLEQAGSASRRLARPQAARRIATMLAKQIGLEPT